MNTKIINAFTILLPVILLIGGSVRGDVRVTGDVTGTWSVNDGHYWVDGNINVPGGEQLIIEPGVQVTFTGNFSFEITGTLNAVGSEEDSIVKDATLHQPGAWQGMTFVGARSARSQLQYCSIGFADRGITLESSSPSISHTSLLTHDDCALRLEGSNITLYNCAITGINGSGIVALEGSNVVIESCTISHCGANGIGVGAESRATINMNTINDNDDNGVYIARDAIGCNVYGNQIEGCGLRGIYLNQCSGEAVLECNIIWANDNHGIYVYSSQNVSIFNNTIWANGGSGIFMYNSDILVSSNIVCEQESDGIYNQASELELRYNCVNDNDRDNYNGTAPGVGDIQADPQLVNPGAGDFNPREESRVIDAGDPQRRDPDGTRADIGALFFNQNEPPEIVNTIPEPFDELRGDQEVEFIVIASDPNGHHLTYTWFLNDEEIGDGNTIIIEFNRDGDYVVRVVVDDGYYLGTTSYEWSFTVYGSVAPEIDTGLPGKFTLSDPYPNPFNSTARIDLEASRVEWAEILICDLRGRTIGNIFRGSVMPGLNSFTLNNFNLPAGSYIITARVGSMRFERGITLIK